MTDAERRPRPRAFRLEGDRVVTPGGEDTRSAAAKVFEPEQDVFASTISGLTDAPGADENATERAQENGVLRHFLFTTGGVFWSALTGLISLALTLWVTQLVEGLFAHSPILGMIGLVLAGALLIAAILLLSREIRAMLRQNRIAKLHIALAAARAENDSKAARERLTELSALYVKRPDMAQARARLKELSQQIIDGRDLVDIAERSLVVPLDALARREIADASKRVSVVTTVSPRALLDVLFVAGQAIVLMRRIA
jgi:putative membrane protein